MEAVLGLIQEVQEVTHARVPIIKCVHSSTSMGDSCEAHGSMAAWEMLGRCRGSRLHGRCIGGMTVARVAIFKCVHGSTGIGSAGEVHWSMAAWEVHGRYRM